MPLSRFLFAVMMGLFIVNFITESFAASPNAYYAGGPGFYSKSSEAACQSRVAARNDASVYNGVEAMTGDVFKCNFYKDDVQNGRMHNYYELYPQYCIQGQEYTQTGCAVPPPPPSCTPGCNGACGSFYNLNSSPPSPVCIQNCFYDWSSDLEGADGKHTFLVANNTGVVCQSPSSATPPGSPCKICECLQQGKSFGTVNGAVVCTAKGTPGSAKSSSVTPGTTTTTTPAPTAQNPNPAPVSSTTPPVLVTITPPPAGSPAGTPPKVSSSQTNPDGSSSSTTEGQESFCTKNPGSEQCKAKSLCEKDPEAPSCKNICQENPDLLVCKQTDIDQLCKDNPDRWECKKAEDLIGKEDDIPDEEVGENEVNIGDDYNFNPANITSNNSCPSPRSMVIAGSTMTISFDWLCEYAAAFKFLIKAWASYIAYGIIAAAIKGDAQPYQRALF